MRIGGIESLSTVDWYGKVSTVVFFAGCNFECSFCFNSHLIPMDSGEEWSWERLSSILEDQRGLIDAVVATGGEPTLQPDAVKILFFLAKKVGLLTMLNTNGSRAEVVESLLKEKLVDRIAMDVKAPLTSYDYSCMTNKMGFWSIRSIKRVMELSKEYSVPLEVRTTVLPSYGRTEIEKIVESIKGCIDEYYLQQFIPSKRIPDPFLREEKPISRDKLLEFGRLSKKMGIKRVFIKTLTDGLEEIY